MSRKVNMILSLEFEKARAEGRICQKCGWMVGKTRWKKGNKICYNCEYGEHGIHRIYGGYWPVPDEPKDQTGEMP